MTTKSHDQLPSTPRGVECASCPLNPSLRGLILSEAQRVRLRELRGSCHQSSWLLLPHNGDISAPTQCSQTPITQPPPCPKSQRHQGKGSRALRSTKTTSPGPGSERVTHTTWHCGARLSTFQESWLTLETSFCWSLETKDPEPRVQPWKEKEWGRGHHPGPVAGGSLLRTGASFSTVHRPSSCLG